MGVASSRVGIRTLGVLESHHYEVVCSVLGMMKQCALGVVISHKMQQQIGQFCVITG